MLQQRLESVVPTEIFNFSVMNWLLLTLLLQLDKKYKNI